MPKPNLFIVGAPKCGTTALSHYLHEHPNVFMSTPKEPHYFASDLPAYRYTDSEEQYLQLFDSASDEHKIVGEASVFYMYSKVAIKKIFAFNPEAKIVVMLRNPVHVVHAMHSQLLYSEDEDEQSMEKAWELSQARKQGKNIPANCRDEKILFYDEIAKLGEQLERLLQVFPKKQVKIILFSDFSKNTQRVYRELLQFLELPDDHRTDFPVINQNKVHRFEKLALFTQRPPMFMIKIGKYLKRLLHVRRLGFVYILQFLRNINMVKKPRLPLTEDLRNKIVRAYKDDILKLSGLTGTDTDYWLT